MAKNGFKYDCTLGFADHLGFRCETCYEFPVYDLLKKKVLSIKERPLIVMERTVLDQDYMGIESYDKAFEHICDLKNCCRLFNGDFTILWHNNRLAKEHDKCLYKSI